MGYQTYGEWHFADYEGDATDALHDAYLLLRERGYSVGDLAPLREAILTETRMDRIGEAPE